MSNFRKYRTKKRKKVLAYPLPEAYYPNFVAFMALSFRAASKTSLQ